MHTVFMAHLHCGAPLEPSGICCLACLPPLACLTLLSQALGPSLPRGARAGGGHRENGPAENLLYETDFPTPKLVDGNVMVKNDFTVRQRTLAHTHIALPAFIPHLLTAYSCLLFPSSPASTSSTPISVRAAPRTRRHYPSSPGRRAAVPSSRSTPKAAEAGLAVGQRVAYSVLGTYCEYTSVPAVKIVNVPDGVGLDTATACMTQG